MQWSASWGKGFWMSIEPGQGKMGLPHQQYLFQNRRYYGEIFVGVTCGPDIKLGFPPQMPLVVAVIFLTPTCLLDRSDKSDTRKSRPRVERHSGIVAMSIAMTTTMVATKTTATTTRKRK